MNTKRQTVWLVSMLSLMVVLSAYYLFTQDASTPDVLTDGSQVEPIGQNVTEAATNKDGLVVNGAEVPSDKETAISDADQDILNQLEKQGIASGGLFSELLAKREMKNSDEENRLMAIVSKTQKKPEEATAAMAEMDMLEDKNSKIMNLESELMKTYEIALVAEESNRYKVVVQSETIEKKQAAAIIAKVMDTFEVGAEQVSVQFVK